MAETRGSAAIPSPRRRIFPLALSNHQQAARQGNWQNASIAWIRKPNFCAHSNSSDLHNTPTRIGEEDARSASNFKVQNRRSKPSFSVQSPHQSGRGLPHSMTLSRIRMTLVSREAFWMECGSTLRRFRCTKRCTPHVEADNPSCADKKSVIAEGLLAEARASRNLSSIISCASECDDFQLFWSPGHYLESPA